MGTPEQELTCKELVELITEYFEGALLPAERKRFEEHLALCKGCRVHLDQMRATISTLGKLDEQSIAPQVKEDLLRAFRTWKA